MNSVRRRLLPIPGSPAMSTTSVRPTRADWSANRTRDHHAAMDADPQAKLDPELCLDPRGMLGEELLHPDRATERALGIVLVGDRRAEDHEDRIADELLDRPVVPERFLGEVF